MNHSEARLPRARPVVTVAAWFVLAAVLLACAPRGELGLAEPVRGTTLQDVWVANHRPLLGFDRTFGAERSDAAVYGRLTVSIPPTHEVGTIEWPRGETDPATDFVTVGIDRYADIRAFARAVAQSDRSAENETVLFVHGYNTTHGEAVYGLAQIAHDLEVPVPTVLFSWPSAAQARGYIYDRDSSLISRDHLEALILELARDPNRELLLTAHSMGSYLLMETLRQMQISGKMDVASRINGVILMAPDIDTELFRAQVERIGDLPEPFILMVAEQDRALRLSAFLTGREARLGSLTDPGALDGLGVTLVDVGSLADGRGFDHNIATTSPAAIAIIRKLNAVTSPGDLNVVEAIVLADAERGLLPGVVPGN